MCSFCTVGSHLFRSVGCRLVVVLIFRAACTRMQKKEAPEGEKPEAVRTHLRNMIIVPEMIGSVIGVYNGRVFNQIEIKVCRRDFFFRHRQWPNTDFIPIFPSPCSLR